MTRRECMFMAVSCTSLISKARAAEAWKKKADEWSDKDIRAILTKSPWVKAATVDFNLDRGGGPPGGGGPGSGGPRGGGPPGGGGPGGGPPGESPGGGPPGEGGAPQIQAVVRWESALPIRLARKTEASAERHQYVFSVSGLPAMGRRGEPSGMQDRMKEGTRLQRKGKPPLVPVSVENRDSDEGAVLLFVFDGSSQPVEMSEKEVTFVMAMGPLKISAKFFPKDMIFGGNLEL